MAPFTCTCFVSIMMCASPPEPTRFKIFNSLFKGMKSDPGERVNVILGIGMEWASKVTRTNYQNLFNPKYALTLSLNFQF